MADIVGKGKRFLQRMRRRVIHAWQTIWAKRHYYTTLQSYVNVSPNKAQILSQRVDDLVYTPIEDCAELYPGGQGVVRKACIKNATCFVFSDIILLDDGQCMYELKELEELQPIANYMDEILLKDTDHWCKLKNCHQTRYIEKAIKIGGMYGFNYYHFMFQLLPRMLETSDIDSSAPLLIDYSARDIPSMRQLVEWFNNEGREVIYMEYDVAYTAAELYIITSPNFCVPHFKPIRYSFDKVAAYSKSCLDRMRENTFPYKKDVCTSKKIFICRNQCSKRRSYNEQELVDIAVELGFTPVAPEKYSMAEQMAIFNEAEIIIAPSGAALTNLLFVNPQCTLILLVSRRGLSTATFGSLINMYGASFVEIADGVADNAKYEEQKNFHIDKIEFLKVIKSIVSKSAK